MNVTVSEGEFVLGSVVVTFVLGGFLHLLIALGLWGDARQISAADGDVRFLPPGVWGIAGLFGGLYALAIYWLIHYSSLRGESYVESRRDEADEGR